MFQIWRENPKLYFNELKKVTLMQVKRGIEHFAKEAKPEENDTSSDNTLDQVDAVVRTIDTTEIECHSEDSLPNINLQQTTQTV